jgi:hypothetical protein
MIRVVPFPLDYGVDPEPWDGIVAALNAEGIFAHLDQPIERRDAGAAAEAVGIFLAGYVGEEVLDAIRRVVWDKLRGKRRLGTMKGQPRRIPIYGPNGDVLSWIEVPSEPNENSDDDARR